MIVADKMLQNTMTFSRPFELHSPENPGRYVTDLPYCMVQNHAIGFPLFI